MSIEALALVPSWRLGNLLREVREAGGQTLDDQASLSEEWDAASLAAAEDGNLSLGDDQLRSIIDLYGIDPAAMAADRSDLVIDLERHQLSASDHTQALAGSAPTPDEVLAGYLSLLYTLRDTRPGASVPLRRRDIEVLEQALVMAAAEIESRLNLLMESPSDLVFERARFLRSRVLVPAAGVLLAVTVAGALVVSSRTHAPAPQPGGPGVAPVVHPVDSSVQIGGAATQTRRTDGTPGPVVLGGGGTTGTTAVAGGVAIGDALVVVRNPDGSITRTSRGAGPTTTTSVP